MLMKKTLSGIILLSIFYLIGCFKSDRLDKLTINESKQLKAEVKSWLKINSKKLANGKLNIALAENKIAIGELSWEAATITQKGNDQIIKVPFIFNQHSFSKNSRLLKTSNQTDLPIMVNLFFRKEFGGKISSVVKISAFNNGGVQGKKEMYFSIYDAELNHISEEYSDLKIVTKVRMRDEVIDQNSASEASSDCQKLSYTQSYIVSCQPGELDNVICSYKKRTVTRYRCYGDSGEGETEVIDWIDAGEPGGSWSEYEEEEEEFANQNIIDSLQGYPCAQSILVAMPNLNAQTKNLIQDVFNSNTDINITFFVDPSLRGTSVDGQKVKGSGAFIFNGTIAMNPDVLEKATKEYILVTFLHESLHAYFKHQVDLYNAKQIDSTTFKQNFLLFWNPDNLGYLNNPTELAEHELMAEKYLTYMKNALISFNPSISQEFATALAWGGLEGTRIYITKVGNDNKVNLLNSIGRDIHFSVPAGQPIPQFFNYSNYNAQNCP